MLKIHSFSRTALYLLVLVFIISCGQADSAHPVKKPKVNLLSNGSFEDPLSTGWGTGQYASDRPTWWNSGKCKSVASRDNKVRRSGSHSLRITNLTGHGPHLFGTTNQKVTIIPNQLYRITLSARAENLTKGALSIVVNDNWKLRPLTLPEGTYDWREFSAEFMMPKNRAEFRILIENKGTVWLDDLKLEALSIEERAPGSDETVLSASQKHFLEELGEPDVFSIIFSGPDRIETWIYHKHYVTISFKNGAFQKESFNVEPLPKSPKRQSVGISPVAIHAFLSPADLEVLVGARPLEVHRETIDGTGIDVYLFPRGISATFTTDGHLLTLMAYAY